MRTGSIIESNALNIAINIKSNVALLEYSNRLQKFLSNQIDYI